MAGLRAVLACGLAAASLVSGAGAAEAQKVTPMPQLDLNRLRGTWYEIARLPVKSEKDCVRNPFEVIAFGDGKKSVQTGVSCTLKDGTPMDLVGSTASQVKSGDGELKVRHWVIFSRKYDVLEISPDNSWMALGTPNHKQLWIFSKKPTLQDEVFAAAKSKATTAGFSLDKLVLPPQDAKTSTQVAAATPANQ